MRFLTVIFLSFTLLLSAFVPAVAAETPEKVYIGAYINDIQQIDLREHSYRLDMYVWFRWNNPAIDPAKSAEFMNALDPSSHQRVPLFDTPQKMPDGSLYMIFRDQGQFSTKFSLQNYPFDHQNLVVMMEDSVVDAKGFMYVPDTSDGAALKLAKDVHIPGFNIGEPTVSIVEHPYPTRFGDLRMGESPSYSRAFFTVPVSRPEMTSGIKVFLPIALVIFCTALVFFVHPHFIEGRLGVAITTLLTLVALQLTSASSLPDVDYLLMTDKVYLVSYAFIIATLMRVAFTSRQVRAGQCDEVRRNDVRVLSLFIGATIIAFYLVM